MQSKRLHATTAAERPIWRANNPNYPGIPQEPEPPPDVLTRATSRATVEYETYVLAYAAQQRGQGLQRGDQRRELRPAEFRQDRHRHLPRELHGGRLWRHRSDHHPGDHDAERRAGLRALVARQ